MGDSNISSFCAYEYNFESFTINGRVIAYLNELLIKVLAIEPPLEVLKMYAVQRDQLVAQTKHTDWSTERVY